jgi:hypothetical protein
MTAVLELREVSKVYGSGAAEMRGLSNNGTASGDSGLRPLGYPTGRSDPVRGSAG